jgi:hypothetical protein
MRRGTTSLRWLDHPERVRGEPLLIHIKASSRWQPYSVAMVNMENPGNKLAAKGVTVELIRVMDGKRCGPGEQATR